MSRSSFVFALILLCAIIFDRFITFDLQRKTLTAEDELGCSFPLELPLLKVITQFYKELGWLDEQDK